MSAPQSWVGIFALSDGTDGLIVFALAFLYFHLLLIPVSTIFYRYISRKLVADIQARVGPNRTGPSGSLQGLADVLKLFFQRGRDTRTRAVFLAQIAALFSIFSALPMGVGFVFVQSELNILLPFISLLILCFFKILEAGNQEKIEDTLIGFRGGFIALSAFVPALCTLLVPCVLSGKMDWESIINIQGVIPYRWFGISSPFGMLGALTFIVSGMILFQVPPFSVSEGERKKYQAANLILFEMTRFYGFFIWCILTVALYFGAAGTVTDGQAGGFFRSHAQIFITLFKAGLIWTVIQIFGKTIPSIRIERITDFIWKFVFPSALISLIGAVFWTVGLMR